MQGQFGEVRITLEIKRAATGKTETVEMVGKVNNEIEDQDNGGNTQHDSTGRSNERSGGPA